MPILSLKLPVFSLKAIQTQLEFTKTQISIYNMENCPIKNLLGRGGGSGRVKFNTFYVY